MFSVTHCLPFVLANRKEIKKVIKEGFEHLATFSLHLLDDSDVVVIFETTTRKDITYMTEETELALVEERNEKLRQREEVIEKKLNEMRRGLRGKRKTLALEKLEELTPWPPPLPPLHPSLIVSTTSLTQVYYISFPPSEPFIL